MWLLWRTIFRHKLVIKLKLWWIWLLQWWKLFVIEVDISSSGARGLCINLAIVLIIHLCNTASNSHLSDPLQLLPIHISRILLVFVPTTHQTTLTFHVTTAERLGISLENVVFPNRTMVLGHPWLGRTIIPSSKISSMLKRRDLVQK